MSDNIDKAANHVGEIINVLWKHGNFSAQLNSDLTESEKAVRKAVNHAHHAINHLLSEQIALKKAQKEIEEFMTNADRIIYGK